MNKETLKLHMDWCKNAPESAMQTGLSIDGKLIGILSASSVVIGVAVAIVAAGNGEFAWSCWSIFAIGFAAGAYVTNFAGTLWHVRPKLYDIADSPNERDRSKWDPGDPETAMEYQWDIIKESYETNSRISLSKAKWLTWSAGLLGAETVALIVWILLIVNT